MKKVLLAMSGGVDSSVAAYILLNQGYDIVGATFTLWKPNGQYNDKEIYDAKNVCENLGIPHMVFNFTKSFKKSVVDDFVSKYKNGLTPSPCIVCNKIIKFGLFYDKAMELGFDSIATGHYARIVKEHDDHQLKMATFKNKDQSYFLYTIPHEKLKNILFPLGDLDKVVVRKIAKDVGLNIASKPDSQEICFINGKYTDFLAERIEHKFDTCNFIDKYGNVIGNHKGIWNYTVGQRKGLGVSFGKPMFVNSIDSVKNTVQLVEYNDTFNRGLIADNVCWHVKSTFEKLKCSVKIRSKSKLCPALIIEENNNVKVLFEKPQNFIAPGQSVVFYDNETVLGGGIIKDIVK